MTNELKITTIKNYENKSVTVGVIKKDCCSDSDNDYCNICGTPNGLMRDMLEEEILKEIERDFPW